ncbi:MAG: ethanolamine utilization protein EutJ [Ardenticatenaceae bacterium]|nr:ethanolamine utilization protein EutJ [Ardenticatenaceae bacterium]MCB8987152.1 ethanolamine utilization protein EutJ [Ardenticatenaceae bacterium]
MNPELETILTQAQDVFNQRPSRPNYHGPVHVGVDLGTAYTVLAVLDAEKRPLAGRYQFAQIVRDGLVVDFIGAIQLLKKMKAEVEADLGFQLEKAATTYPPGVPLAEVKATRNVLIGAGLECSHFVDEPTGANALLQVRDGAVVDIGGGTTGIAIVRDGEVIYTADEATGGTHFSLVVAGALNVSFEEAERIKTDPAQSRMVSSVVYPVMQKVGSIVARHIQPYNVETIYLVGGTSSLADIGEVVHDMTGVPTVIPPHPMFVTPLGVAMTDD